MQNYASKVKVINSFRAESAEFLSCRAGELITLIAKDCYRYTVIVCFSAFSLLANRPARLAIKLPLCRLKRGCGCLWHYIFGTWKYIRYVTNPRYSWMLLEHWKSRAGGQ